MLSGLITVAACALAVSPTEGQILSISDAVQCSTCEIVFENSATLGADPDGPLLSRLSSVAMDRDGLFYVGSTYERGTLAIFDSTGQYLRSFGRLGRGPGEFAAPIMRVRVGPDNRIHVFEGPRHTVLAPKAAEFERLRTLPFMPRGLGFTDAGHLLINAFPAPASADSAALVHVLQNGEIKQVLVPAKYDPRYSFAARRVFANGPGETVWIGMVARYHIQQWSVRDGQLRKEIQREAAWFPAWSGDNREVFGNPRLVSMALDDQGLLWTLTVLPDRESPQPLDPTVPVAETDLNDVLDTVIEVIDPGSAGVVYRTRLSDHAPRFLGGKPTIFVRKETEGGNILVHVYDLKLRGWNHGSR